MPEVISLLSSPEEPRPANPPARPAATSHLPPRPSRIPILSDDSLFDWKEPENPTKRRRLSPSSDLSPSREPTPPRTTNPLFSDLEQDNGLSSPIGRLNPYHASTLNNRWDADGSDPITFTSSAVDPTTAHGAGNSPKKPPVVITLDDDFGEFDELSSPSGPFAVAPPPASKSQLSDRTASLLARIGNRSIAASSKSKPKRIAPTISTTTAASLRNRVKQSSIPISSDDDSPPQVAISKTKRAPKLSEADREAREAEKLAAKARREREKEEEKERKQKLKEQKAKEKQLAADLAEANKKKVDKKVSTPEMIIDISSSLEESSVGNQVSEYMRHLGVERHFVPTRIENIVTWRRKITAQYNDEAGYWEPCPLVIKKEDHVLCLLPAQEFVAMSIATDGTDHTLESHVSQIQRGYPDCKPIYLIEGLTIWMRKNNNSRNRAYQASVLRELNATAQPQSSQAPKRQRNSKQTAPAPPVDDDTIEDALLQLQVQHGCLIHHTAAAAESAEWIKNFTENISTIPYRRERINLQDASFCMDVGQVRTGEDNADTYVKMLQEIQRVTAPISYGITMQYPTVGELVRELKGQGPLMLEDVKKCANKTGALTEARVGPAMSKRIHKVFTGLNPSSTDI
ncbi:hypothetical protein FQN55_002613 [Onygenales sp. PD_40]|nr:hypothetical protein FQN55_002613 [Onygenales sp. PD_40]